MSKTNKNTKKDKPEIIVTLEEKANVLLVNKLLASDEISDEQKKKLNFYRKKINNGYISVDYCYSDMKQGRLNAVGASLQSFKRKIRHTLAKDIYLDIDIVNAGPTILQQYCQKNDIECEMLDRYVKYREKWLKELMDFHEITRDQAKEMIIILTYMGNYQIKNEDDTTYEPEEKFSKIVKFSEEMKRIGKEVCKIEKELKKLVEEHKKPNIKASVLSITIQKIENECMRTAGSFFESKGFNVDVLCYDGFMMQIRKNFKNEDLDKLLLECNKYVAKKTGYIVKFVNKEMDELIEIPEESAFVNSDLQVQEKLFRLEDPDYFRFCKGKLFIFNENTGMFDDCDESKDAPLNYYLTKHRNYFYVDTSNNPEFQKYKSYGEDTTLMGKVKIHVHKASRNDDWVNKTANTSLGYLLFKDGIYNFKTNKLTKEFNPKIVFYNRVPHKFPERVQKEVDYANNLSFKLMCGSDEKSLPLRVAFARALAGDTTAKKFYFCPGKTDAGKSKLMNMFENCFGRDIVHSFNAECLAYNEKSGQDEAQRNRWVLLVRYARIIFSNEANMKKTLDGNYIKRIAAGGDSLIGRTHHANEQNFKPHFTAFCILNDIPTIDPMDDAVYNRLTYFEFEKQFVDKLNPNNPNELQKDPNLDEKINSKKFIRGFTHLILDAYKYYLENGQPEFDQITKEEWTADGMKDKNLANIISESFNVTKNEEDYITVTEFTDFRNRNKKEFSTISNKRFAEVLRSMGAVQGKHGKNGTRVWRGIQKIVNVDDDDL
ncbi:MAG TPA: hypothetical protein PKG56_00055 [Chitinophagaceae bacterium]|nr:hypothetical protein [Chitinophagaceae bacterium]